MSHVYFIVVVYIVGILSEEDSVVSVRDGTPQYTCPCTGPGQAPSSHRGGLPIAALPWESGGVDYMMFEGGCQR